MRKSSSKSLAPLYFSFTFSLAVLSYCLSFGRSAPFSDEWKYFSGVVDFSWGWLMEPLNEHWLPLPKLLYVGTVRAFGLDVRAVQVLTVVILTGAALLAARELIRRDNRALSWLVPIVVFLPAQYETLLSGTNVHFALCAALLIAAGVLAVQGRAFGPVWSLIVVALSLSGATGLLYSVPLAVGGLFDPGRTARSWAWRLFALISVAGVSTWYGLYFEHPRATPAYSLDATPRAALQALGVVLNSRAALLAGVLIAVVATFGIAILCTSPRISRRQRVGLLMCVAAIAFGALGIGYGRGMDGPGSGVQSRFASLVMPLFIVLLLIASVDTRDRFRQSLAWCLAGVALLAWPLNARNAWIAGEAQKTVWRQFENDVRAGATFEQIIGRDGGTAIQDDDVQEVPERLNTLYALKIGPFEGYQGTLRHTATAGSPRTLDVDPGVHSVRFDQPSFLRAVHVRFRLHSDNPSFLNYVTLQWKSPGTPAHTASVYAEGDGRIYDQLFWLWNDVNVLSLSTNRENDPGLRIEELAVFEGHPSELPSQLLEH